MEILFFEPPKKLQTGGLQAALESLRRNLDRAGVAIRVADRLPDQPLSGTVAHFHGLWQPSHARIAKCCRNEGVPYIVSPHGMLEPWAWRHKRWKKLPYFRIVERRFLAHASCLLATAAPEAENLRGFFPEARVETIPLGLTGTARPAYTESRRILGWENDEWILVFLSRIHPKKGIEILIDALAGLGVSRPARLRLVIVGGGAETYLRHLKAQCASRAAELPTVDWIGEVWGEEKWRYLQGADLFLLPTYSENFGLAVLEACQVGTRALTTTATPWGPFLADGRGYIAEPTAESVAESLAEAFKDGKTTPGQRKELADWAHTTFDWNKLAGEYCALYQSLAADPVRQIPGRAAGSG